MARKSSDSSFGFRLLSVVGAMGAGFLARKAVSSTYKLATGNEPPANPEDPDVAWREAVAWALVSGAAIGFGRLLASRQAAAWYRKSTGKVPANIQSASS